METDRQREREGEREREIKLYFSTVKILAQRPTRISAIATITKTFIVKYYDRRIQTNTASIIIMRRRRRRI